MKSLFVVLLVVVVAEARQICVPGTTFKQSCNTCFCTSDGLSAACTHMGYLSENKFKIYPSFRSTTEQPKKDEISYSTRKREAKQVCIPNTTFMQSCNSCFCNSDGTDAFCTLKGYPEKHLWVIDPATQFVKEKPSNEEGALKLEKRSKRQTETRQVCIPNTTWHQDCNFCFCNAEGTVAGCTLMACIPKDLWKIDPATQFVTEKPSNEGEP